MFTVKELKPVILFLKSMGVKEAEIGADSIKVVFSVDEAEDEVEEKQFSSTPIYDPDILGYSE